MSTSTKPGATTALAFPTAHPPASIAADGNGNVFFSSPSDTNLYEISQGAFATGAVTPVAINTVLTGTGAKVFVDSTPAVWTTNGKRLPHPLLPSSHTQRRNVLHQPAQFNVGAFPTNGLSVFRLRPHSGRIRSNTELRLFRRRLHQQQRVAIGRKRNLLTPTVIRVGQSLDLVPRLRSHRMAHRTSGPSTTPLVQIQSSKSVPSSSNSLPRLDSRSRPPTWAADVPWSSIHRATSGSGWTPRTQSPRSSVQRFLSISHTLTPSSQQPSSRPTPNPIGAQNPAGPGNHSGACCR